MVQPIVPLGGLAGFRLLERTYDRQLALFAKNPELERDVVHFREAAGSLLTVDDLMADFRSLRLVLGAFGLEEDLPKRAFVRKVIEEGSLDPDAFANRLSDPSFKELAETVGIGNFGSRLTLSSVQEDLVTRYRARQFEKAVGEQDIDLRLALNFRREIGRIADGGPAGTAGWFSVLGSRPLRRVIETAYGLPQQFALIDLDQQVTELRRLTRERYGLEGPEAFRDPEILDAVIDRFLLRSQALGGTGNAAAAGSTALQILGAGGLGGASQAGLVRSSLF